MTTLQGQQVAGALLVNARGDVLLQHRDTIPTIAFPGHWSLFGGSLEPNETPEQAVVREIKEELGYTLPYYQHLLTLPGASRIAYVYLAPLEVPKEALTLYEGQDFELFAPQQALASLKLTDMARLVLQTFIHYQQYRHACCDGVLFNR